MDKLKVYGWGMALISETYLSTLSEIMTPQGIERYFVPFLHICANSGNITQKDLAESLKRDKVSVMRIVDHLSEKGLVNRKQNEVDRRCQLLEATALAHQLVPKVKAAITKTNDLLFSEFSEEEREVFEKGMNKLMKQINTLPESNFIIEATKREKN